MCGIAGQVALSASHDVDEQQTIRMLRSIAHRGPDGEGMFVDQRRRIALGSRRLAIIDLVTGDQPILNEDRSIACVFNGEIYNFQALRMELEHKGHIFRSRTDTEVIVHLYEEDGPDCLRRLRGMFAVAIWDAREQRLLLARDRLGKKPLYYTDTGGVLSFASEITALYGLPGLVKEVDPVALDLYLTHSYVPAPYSIFLAIKKLPPGHFLTVQHGTLAVNRYWTLDTTAASGASRHELVKTVRAKLEESVKLRMISDVPLGCFLSGGTDSSSVVALMTRVSDKPVKTFSIGFTSDRYNELGYARTVAALYRTEHHEYVVDPDAVAVLPDIARHFGEPFGDPSALPTWYVSQLTRKHVTVALNGDGGDELFGGYPWYKTALLLARLERALPAWTGSMLAKGRPISPRIARLGRRLRMSPAERFASLRRMLDPDTKRELYSSTLLAASRGAAEAYLVGQYEAAAGDDLACMLYTDTLTYLPEDLLVKVDRMTMAHSLEGRSPLLDHELVEFCAAIPSVLKIGHAGTKILFREAMADLFPPGFLDRPKMGFSVPIAEWVREQLRDRCYRVICGDALMDRGWFNPQTVRAMLTQHTAGTQDNSSLIWNLLMLGEWANLFTQ